MYFFCFLYVDQPAGDNLDVYKRQMLFTINTSPFFGKEGKFVTSRHLRDRLYKETEKNLALRVEDMDTEDVYKRQVFECQNYIM